MPEIQFEYPSWLVLACLLAGGLYSWLLYSKKHPWNKFTNRSLAVLRGFMVGFILILLLNPLLKQLLSEIEKPVLIIAVDNSLSLSNSIDSTGQQGILQRLSALRAGLEGEGFEVNLKGLDRYYSQANNIQFNQKTTELNGLLREIENDYDGRNLHSVVLLSDGNYNRGTSPAYFPYAFPIHSLGIGDTAQYDDLALQNVMYNKIAYQGNRFPIAAEISNSGFGGREAVVKVLKQGKTIASQSLNFSSDNGLSTIEFNIEADSQGTQHYRIALEAKGEEITENNYKDIFVEVIDGRQKILVLALAPHPDIKALRAVIEANQNYDYSVYIPGLNQFKEDTYDLVIAHTPGDRYQRLQPALSTFRQQKLPIFYILGSQSYSQQLSTFNFKPIRNQRDEAAPSLNIDFSKFKINPDYSDVFNEYPTLNVPYGELSLTPASSVLLYQKIGSVTTDKPLLYLHEAESVKSAYLMADGIWRWRLQEYANTEDTEAFDDIFLKLVQYLCTKEDKRKFRVYTSQGEFFDNEPVVFEAETYNDSYERIFGNKVSVKTISAAGSEQQFSFIPSSAASRLEVTGLGQGVYRFEAQTRRDDKPETIYGRFTVKEMQLELLDQRANFDLLRQVSKNTGGAFHSFDDIDKLEALLGDTEANQAKAVMHSTEDFFALINLKALFFLLLTLLSVEWFTRKYSGGY